MKTAAGCFTYQRLFYPLNRTKECHPPIPKYRRSHLALWCAKHSQQLLKVNNTSRRVAKQTCLSVGQLQCLMLCYLSSILIMPASIQPCTNPPTCSWRQSAMDYCSHALVVNWHSSACNWHLTSAIVHVLPHKLAYPLHQQIYVSGSRITLLRAHQREKGWTNTDC